MSEETPTPEKNGNPSKNGTPQKNGTPPKNSKLYTSVIKSVDKYVPNALRPLWMHPAGPKTVFFWAPICKWGLVIAGLDDVLRRPAELVAVKQSLTLLISAIIWSRWSVVIIPKNYSLLSVNMGVAMIQFYQCGRALNYYINNKESR